MSSMMSPGMHPVLAALEGIDAHLDDLGEANLWSLLDSESLEVRAMLERIGARVYGAQLASTRDVDSRGAAIKAGAPSLRAWLINRLRIHPGEATRQVALAAQVSDDLPVVAAALAAGEITGAAAAVIADASTELAKFASAADCSEAEAVLVEHAKTLNVRHLQNVALHLRHRLDPDQGERLAREEQQQAALREFSLRVQPDGSSRPAGYLDKEATAFLATALDPLAKPRPAADGERDLRTPAQRRGDALVELVELALRSGDLPQQAGQPVQVAVTVSLDDLQSRLTQAGAGTLDTGLPVSAETVRRLACDAQIIPVVLGSHGEPLNVGRASRDATPAIRRALNVRDKGCAFPGCERPPAWCIAHHICHWEHNGETSCANCVLLCGHHHKVVHHHGWDVRIETDGLPTFYPPDWIDPDRQPRRNHRYKPHPSPSAHAIDGPTPSCHSPDEPERASALGVHVTGTLAYREPMITCVVNYTIDSAKVADFERFAKAWIGLVNSHGGKHHGYFLPAEGASDQALALFSFPSLADYERYRELFGVDPDFIAADRIRDDTGCVTRYERTFMRPVLSAEADDLT